MIKNYVAIDFSMNFPTICILQNSQHRFISLMRKKEIKGRTKKCYEFLNSLDSFEFIQIENMDTNSEYSDSQTNRIIDASTIAELILHKLISTYNIKPEESIICIEGFSYASTASRVAEISGYAYVLRYLLNKAKFKVEIASPSTIKKFAGKGNFKKADMFRVFLESNLLEPHLKKPFNENLDIISSKENPNKPFEDIVDTFWIAEYIKNKFIEIKTFQNKNL